VIVSIEKLNILAGQKSTVEYYEVAEIDKNKCGAIYYNGV
jgi:hypothetical protein